MRVHTCLEGEVGTITVGGVNLGDVLVHFQRDELNNILYFLDVLIRVTKENGRDNMSETFANMKQGIINNRVQIQ